MRSLLNRLKPGAGRRPGATGGASPNDGKTKSRSLLGRATRSVGRATGRASRAAGTKLFGIRPSASPPKPSGSGKPSGKGKNKPPGGGGGGKPDSSSTLDLGVVWTGLGASGRLVGRGAGALLKQWRKRKKTTTEDDFDPDSTYEVGIDGEVIDGKHTDPELGEIAKGAQKAAAARARKLAKQRAKQAAAAAKAAPVWPNLDVDDVPLPPVQGQRQEWPDYDVDDYAPKSEQQRPPKQSLPRERDHDPPPSPPVSPPSHRETGGEKPRPTSTNTTHGGKPVSQPKITQRSTPSGVSAANYAHHITTTPDGRATGWDESADHARRDAVEFDSKADKKDAAASEFARAGNKDAEDKARADAARFREDASTCRTIAAGYQDEANKEASSAA